MWAAYESLESGGPVVQVVQVVQPRQCAGPAPNAIGSSTEKDRHGHRDRKIRLAVLES